MKIKKRDYLLLLLFFYDFFTSNRIYLTDNIFIPYYLCGTIGFYFLAMNYNRIKFIHIAYLIIIYTITLTSSILSPSLEEYMTNRIFGLIQIIYSTLVSYGYFLMLSRYSKKSLAELFLLIIILILGSSAIELLFKQSQIISATGYHHNKIFGLSRVTLGGSETSYLAIMYLFALNGWYFLNNNNNKYIYLILFTLLGFILIFSPIVFLSLILAMLGDICFKVSKYNAIIRFFNNSSRVVLTISLFVIVLIVFVGSRLSNVLSLSETSSIIRIIAPPILAIQTISRYPLWGVGVSSLPVVDDIFFDVYNNMFGYDLIGFGYEYNNAITNGLFTAIMFYGIIGIILLYYCLKYYSRVLGSLNWFYVITALIVFSQVHGSVVTPPIWIIYFTLVLISKNQNNLNYSSTNVSM